jgi:hypothetical protein
MKILTVIFGVLTILNIVGAILVTESGHIRAIATCVVLAAITGIVTFICLLLSKVENDSIHQEKERQKYVKY